MIYTGSIESQNVTNKENTVVGFKITPYMNTQHIQAIRSDIFQ
jgi:hypothetical protein